MQVFKGDVGMFRKALFETGFVDQSERQIFNDRAQTFRRLKLWFATSVFIAEQTTQRRLEAKLREYFGDRILAMYFIKTTRYGAPSLCIKLKD